MRIKVMAHSLHRPALRPGLRTKHRPCRPRKTSRLSSRGCSPQPWFASTCTSRKLTRTRKPPLNPITQEQAEVSIDPEIADFDPATGGVTCKLCSIALNSKSQYQDHLKGKKHFKKVSAEERKKARDTSQILTARTVACTDRNDGAVQVWGAYVPSLPYQ